MNQSLRLAEGSHNSFVSPETRPKLVKQRNPLLSSNDKKAHGGLIGGVRLRRGAVCGLRKSTPLRPSSAFNRAYRLRTKVASVPTQTTSADDDNSDEKIATDAELGAQRAKLEAVLEKPPSDQNNSEDEFGQKTLQYIKNDSRLFDSSRLKKLSSVQRTFEIWGFVFQLLWKRFLVEKAWSYKRSEKDGKVIKEAAKKARLVALATWLRDRLLSLGPTFIKIGQQFSTRVDVLAPELIQELEKLQDQVPPFGREEAVATVEQQLGGSLSDKFTSFNPQPIAAASLGQVHKATLKDGRNVVVKVQRPGLRELFTVDLKNIRLCALILQKLDPKTDGAARDWVAIYDECSAVLYEEIDYRKEGANADAFRKNFKKYDWVKVPEIYWEYSSEKVLTMEYAPGIKINNVEQLDKQGIDKTRLARLSVESYLLQTLKFGLFHADPHPGNIAVSPTNGGTLIYYDFGMMGRLQPGVREGLLKLFYSIYERKPEAALEGLIQMGVLVPTGNDLTPIRRTAKFFLDSFYERLETQEDLRETDANYSDEFKAAKTKEEKKARRKEILANIGEDLLLVAADQPFRFPATFTFVVRAFTVLDGLGKCLDKKFDISEISRPYARALLLEGTPQIIKAQQGLVQATTAQARALINLFKAPDGVSRLDTTVARLESGDLKLRVRALEAERALNRVSMMQAATVQGIIAATAANIGTVLWVGAQRTAATAAFSIAGLLAFAALFAILKVKKLAKKEAALTGAA
ncbi:hypothetical protein CYMTET_20530 [Cymbomonas tetramitiformis]|uniref:ABC1 atypical kinase-like domain-containing protein n=1 Tax=Cymbomonas tetramitiformis TaxID=36881 RepID=A0AAE0G582_9CHLO|nr:hypothetical protein CYMTET_20530 [Cymbomonas tetramitiformis]